MDIDAFDLLVPDLMDVDNQCRHTPEGTDLRCVLLAGHPGRHQSRLIYTKETDQWHGSFWKTGGLIEVKMVRTGNH